MQLQEDYQVSLDAFQGPLDLLLFLIRRAEVDINDIPISEITEQYLSFLRQVDEIDVDVAGEFLVMAATLVEVKARTIAPPLEEGNDGTSGEASSDSGGAVDPRFELVQQLLAYQKYRVASELLDDRRLAFLNRFPVRPAKDRRLEESEQTEFIELELEDAHPMDLAETFEHIMSSIDFNRLGDHLVEMDDTPIVLHEEDLLDRLAHSPDQQITLQEAFEGRSTGERIGLFLATLELTRMRRVVVIQDLVEDPVVLVLNDDPEPLVIETDGINLHRPEPDADAASAASSSDHGDEPVVQADSPRQDG